ncbi:MAG: xanthine dehydrogenase family protein subunit M [Acidobacteriaceae bacterium]|jgi:xanthine dehydrogenase YagS FAD-binding subunit|nr:xanthine dehydrogenase family protein subunit M [Acidobacteriaceae bacterium]
MKAFTSVSPRSLPDAVTALSRARQQGQHAIIVGGGSDALALIKERLIAPDLVVRLTGIRQLDGIARDSNGLTIGGETTLAAMARHDELRRAYGVLAQAAESVATPQIRNAGTLAGNLAQRPWCWYYRNGFTCFKNGGNTCYSAAGENQFNAIFGGGPSFIVHPSDTAPALVALDATFRIVGPKGERTVPAAQFFTLPTVNPARENALEDDEVLTSIHVPAAKAGMRSLYHKVMDREAWTHAIVSAAAVLRMDGNVCRDARIVLGGVAPIPWRLTEVEKLLVGQTMNDALIDRAAAASTTGARPLRNNAYKVPLVQAVVGRALTDLRA